MPTAQQVEVLLSGIRDTSGEPLAAGKVYHYAAGTTTDKNLYTTSTKSANATQPLILDGYGRSQVWADGAYKFIVKDSSDNTIYTWDNIVYGYDDGELLWGGTSAGTGNAQTVTTTGSLTAYAIGQRILFKAGNSNSGATTLNVNSLGAISVTKRNGTALAANDIRANEIVDVMYDSASGGRFVLLSIHNTLLRESTVFNIGTASAHDLNFQTNATTQWTIGGSTGYLYPTTDAVATLGATGAHIGSAYIRNVLSTGGNLVVRTDSAHPLLLGAGGATRWTLDGTTYYLYPATDGTYDFGATTNHIQSGYFENLFRSGGTMAIGTLTSDNVDFYTNNTVQWRIIGASGVLQPPGDALATFGGTSNHISSGYFRNVISNGGKLSLKTDSSHDMEFYTNGTLRASFSAAQGHFELKNVGAAPGTPTAAGIIYVESGALKYKGSSGTVTTVGVA